MLIGTSRRISGEKTQSYDLLWVVGEILNALCTMSLNLNEHVFFFWFHEIVLNMFL